MYGTWLEETRSSFECIEVLEKAIVSEELAMQDNPKERAISEHRIHNFLTLIQNQSKTILSFVKEETALKK